MTVFPLAAERVTVIVASTVPVFPSTTVVLLIDAIETSASSSVMVAVPVPSAIEALLEAPDNVTVKVSLSSSSAGVSSSVCTVTVFETSPGANVSGVEPLAVKSPGAAAVPFAVW